MLYGTPQRLVVNLSPREVYERIEARTEPEHELLRAGNLVEGMRASRRKHMNRLYNLQYVIRWTRGRFQIEATGQKAGQMGMLEGTLTPWGERTIIDARYVPNRHVWVTVSVVTVFCTVGALLIIPAVIAGIVGFLMYRRAQYSQRVLEEFLAKLFADVVDDQQVAAADEIVSATLVSQPEHSANPLTVRGPSEAPFTVPGPDYRMRMFSDRSGKFQINAKFVDVEHRQTPPTVRLCDSNGTEQGIGLDQLCEEDQQWIQRELHRRARPQIAANKALAKRRMGIILAFFASLFVITLAGMCCVFLVPFLELLLELQK